MISAAEYRRSLQGLNRFLEEAEVSQLHTVEDVSAVVSLVGRDAHVVTVANGQKIEKKMAEPESGASEPLEHIEKDLPVSSKTLSELLFLGLSNWLRLSVHAEWHCLSWRGTLRKIVKNTQVAIDEQGAELCPITIHPIHGVVNKDLPNLPF